MDNSSEGGEEKLGERGGGQGRRIQHVIIIMWSVFFFPTQAQWDHDGYWHAKGREIGLSFDADQDVGVHARDKATRRQGDKATKGDWEQWRHYLTATAGLTVPGGTPIQM